MWWCAVALVLAAGCGRLGFDPHAGDATVNDAPVDPLPAPVLAWVIPIGREGEQVVHAVAATGDDGLVAGGDMTAVTDVGGGPLPAFGDYDGWIASYDAQGAHRWSRSFGTAAEDKVFALAADGDGNVYVGGRAGGPIDFGGGVRSAGGGGDLYIASYDPAGAHRWSRMFGSDASGEITFGLAVRADQVYLTGWFENTVDLGDGPRTSIDGQDVFVAAFDTEGVIQRSWRFGGIGLDQGQKIAIGPDGDVAVAGLFVQEIDFGAGPVAGAGNHDAFIVRFGPDGSIRWSRVAGAIGQDRATGIAAGPAGETYAVGLLTTSIDFGLGPVTGTIATDGYVVAFDAAGTAVWNHALVGGGNEVLDEVHVGPDAVLVVNGWYQDTATLAGTSLPTRGSTDALIAGFDRAGTLLWSHVFGGPGTDLAVALSVAPDGTIYIGGEYNGELDFGDGVVHAPVGVDGFIMRMTR